MFPEEKEGISLSGVTLPGKDFTGGVRCLTYKREERWDAVLP